MARPSRQLESVVGEDRLIWRSKPKKSAFLTVNILKQAFGLIFTIFFAFVISMTAENLLAPVAQSLGLSPGFLATGIGVLFVIASIIGGGVWMYLKYSHAEYAATDMGLVQFGGIIGRDYSTVDWDDVQDLEVDVGLLDKIFGTGSINARTAGIDPSTLKGQAGATSLGGQGVHFRWVENPYEVLEDLKEGRGGERRSDGGEGGAQGYSQEGQGQRRQRRDSGNRRGYNRE